MTGPPPVRPTELDATFVPRRADATYTVEIDGEAIVLDEHLNRLHLLNATGTLVWACCDGTGTVAEIATDLADATSTPYDEVLAGVLDLVRTLGAEGLLAGVAGDPAATGVAVPEVEVSGPPS